LKKPHWYHTAAKGFRGSFSVTGTQGDIAVIPGMARSRCPHRGLHGRFYSNARCTHPDASQLSPRGKSCDPLQCRCWAHGHYSGTSPPPDRNLQLVQPGSRRPRVFNLRDGPASPRAEVEPCVDARTVRLHLPVPGPLAEKHK